jgi:hypothetical protein
MIERATYRPRKQRVIQEGFQHGQQAAPVLAEHVHRDDTGLLVAASRSWAVVSLVARHLPKLIRSAMESGSWKLTSIAFVIILVSRKGTFSGRYDLS